MANDFGALFGAPSITVSLFCSFALSIIVFLAPSASFPLSRSLSGERYWRIWLSLADLNTLFVCIVCIFPSFIVLRAE